MEAATKRLLSFCDIPIVLTFNAKTSITPRKKNIHKLQ